MNDHDRFHVALRHDGHVWLATVRDLDGPGPDYVVVECHGSHLAEVLRQASHYVVMTGQHGPAGRECAHAFA